MSGFGSFSWIHPFFNHLSRYQIHWEFLTPLFSRQPAGDCFCQLLRRQAPSSTAHCHWLPVHDCGDLPYSAAALPPGAVSWLPPLMVPHVYRSTYAPSTQLGLDLTDSFIKTRLASFLDCDASHRLPFWFKAKNIFTILCFSCCLSFCFSFKRISCMDNQLKSAMLYSFSWKLLIWLPAFSALSQKYALFSFKKDSLVKKLTSEDRRAVLVF